MATRLILICCALALPACAGAGGGCEASFSGQAPARCQSPAAGARLNPARNVALVSPSVYCSAESGFAAGARGETYAGVCSGEAADAFLSAFSKGERLFELERDAIAAAQAASDVNKDLWQIKRRIMEVETRRLSSITPRSERNELSAELRILHEQRAVEQAEVDRLLELKANAELALASYRRALAAEMMADTAPATEPKAASYP